VTANFVVKSENISPPNVTMQVVMIQKVY